MPTYRYECQACGHGFELFQSMSDKLKRKCPSCGKPRLDRLIGAGAGVIFKGSGFYQTDYKNAGRSGSETSSGEGAAKPADAKSESKSESKSDAKSDGGSASAAKTGSGKSLGGTKKDSGSAAKKSDN